MKYIVAALLALMASVGSAAAQAPDASGRWEVVLNAPDGAHKATLNLNQVSCSLILYTLTTKS